VLRKCLREIENSKTAERREAWKEILDWFATHKSWQHEFDKYDTSHRGSGHVEDMVTERKRLKRGAE
jgi:hypothetical protein